MSLSESRAALLCESPNFFYSLVCLGRADLLDEKNKFLISVLKALCRCRLSVLLLHTGGLVRLDQRSTKRSAGPHWPDPAGHGELGFFLSMM